MVSGTRAGHVLSPGSRPPNRVRTLMSMRKVTGSLVAFTLVVGCHVGGERTAGPTVRIAPGDNLRLALDTLRGPVTVALAPGDYHLRPVGFTDPTCGDCEEASAQVPATRGLRISGREVHIVGTSAREVVIHTWSGYGVLFDGCEACTLEGVTVTDGARDSDDRATDAGVVIRQSRVTLTDCIIRDNLGDSTTVHEGIAGIGGVAVREGGYATVRRCRIERNSWHGVAAYRGARLEAIDNVVDGVDRVADGEPGGGRGAGVAMTRGAEGHVEGNLVTRYRQGIGVFGGARADVLENVIEDVATWGIAVRHEGPGSAGSHVTHNVVFETGACGVSIYTQAPRSPSAVGHPSESDSAAPLPAAGSLRANILVRTGQDERYDGGVPYCQQRPIALHGVSGGFSVDSNLVHDVRQPGDAPRAAVLTRSEFQQAATEVLRRIGSRPHLADSRFYRAFGSVP